MQSPFNIGDTLHYRKVVTPEDVAAFHGKEVHPVCSTFALARDIEWTSRQFVLQMCDSDEEGVGTMLTITHQGPAFVGDEVVFTARILHLEGHELRCTYEARVGDRLIATGETGQKIMKRSRLEALFNKR
ncbi:thioesterase family protein [Chryseolinea lacunae]|uniref:Fluoroacetyl-CoA-specific thioesterase-like domain-containing protein n=1 Tax=Chryseolinea lacunae TaxID=2801331 RepID=A0ABS1L111_9BACT|nr:hotdog domain-containing protein [Chryseolinea lacunae]MBL0745396.1 hypothetical protein [Chryseolinea lacunae]